MIEGAWSGVFVREGAQILSGCAGEGARLRSPPKRGSAGRLRFRRPRAALAAMRA